MHVDLEVRSGTLLTDDIVQCKQNDSSLIISFFLSVIEVLLVLLTPLTRLLLNLCQHHLVFSKSLLIEM